MKRWVVGERSRKVDFFSDVCLRLSSCKDARVVVLIYEAVGAILAILFVAKPRRKSETICTRQDFILIFCH